MPDYSIAPQEHIRVGDRLTCRGWHGDTDTVVELFCIDDNLYAKFADGGWWLASNLTKAVSV